MNSPKTSTEKVTTIVHELADRLPELQRRASGMNAMMIAPLMGFTPQLRRLALEQIPSDPAELDRLLTAGAALLLSLRSDTVEADGVEIAA